MGQMVGFHHWGSNQVMRGAGLSVLREKQVLGTAHPTHCKLMVLLWPAKPLCPFPSHLHWLVTVRVASRPSRGQLPQQSTQQLTSLKS